MMNFFLGVRQKNHDFCIDENKNCYPILSIDKKYPYYFMLWTDFLKN